MSFTDLELMELAVEAGFRHTPEGRLLESREVDPSPSPRFLLGLTRGGNLWRFRHDLPASLVRDLDALAAAEPVLPDLPREPVDLSQYRELLQEQEEIRDTGFDLAYAFPEELSPGSGPSAPPQVVRITGVNSPPRPTTTSIPKGCLSRAAQASPRDRRPASAPRPCPGRRRSMRPPRADTAPGRS